MNQYHLIAMNYHWSLESIQKLPVMERVGYCIMIYEHLKAKYSQGGDLEDFEE
jgi:hypothetical protein